jgi:DNA-binding beta-propeller fold protein YncE
MKANRLLPLLAMWVVVATTAGADDNQGAPAELANQSLRGQSSIALPDVTGPIDHLWLDLPNQRLFVAELGNDAVDVVDLRLRRPVQRIVGLDGPQCVIFVAKLGKLIVSNVKDGRVQWFDAIGFTPSTSIALGDDADAMRYDADEGRLYVANGVGTITILEASSGRILATLDLKSAVHAEAFCLESNSKRLFVNLPRENKIVVIDRQKGNILATWELTEAGGNFAMALDETGHRLLVACRKPAKLLVIDTESGKTINSYDIAGSCDDIYLDSAGQRVYLSCGEGYVEAFDRLDADKYELSAKIATAVGARTSVWSDQLHRLYLAVPERTDQRSELRIFKSAPARPSP